MGGTTMRVLVTGASGHVGGAIATRLLGCGHEVVGLGRRQALDPRFSDALAVDIGRPGLASTVATETKRCEAIVHAAATLERDPFVASVTLTNGFGTQQIVELAGRWEVASLVYISSLPAIGRPSELPVTEQHPTRPLTAYHASKLYGEQLVSLGSQTGVSLRITSPVGPGMPDNTIMPALIRNALAGEPLVLHGRGSRGQDYVDLRDVAAAASACIENRASGLLNIASGRCVSNLELARTCTSLLGSGSEITFSGSPDPDDDVRWEISIERAGTAIGYRPRHSLEDSIAAVAEQIMDGLEHA
jgi:nucleoside-diphosphate-sugar epimerase